MGEHVTPTRRQFTSRPKIVEAKVLKRKDVTDDLLLVWITRPEGLTFKPGQYCTIGIDGIERAYSISSAPYEEDLELFVELVPLPEGNLTPLIWDLNEGDTVTIRPRAKGIFTFKSHKANQLMVATVTGVVPFVSIVRQYLHDDESGHHFYILEGASYVDEFTYDTELRELEVQNPDVVTFIPTVSRPSEERNLGWRGQTGRVNSVVNGYVDQFGLTKDDTVIYACGHPEMIEDVKGQFLPKGFQVEEERFWKQDE